MKIVRYPWEHCIIDNYYKEELFNSMKIELLSYYKNFYHKSKNFRFIRQENTDKWICTYTGIEARFPHTVKCVDSVELSESILSNFTCHREYTNLKTRFDISISTYTQNIPDYEIHDDIASKVLTTVTYIYPHKSRGTILYDKNKVYATEAPWKLNSTLIFPPIDNITWHSYEPLPNSYRIVLNQFLER
jgi:hypothetical protein